MTETAEKITPRLFEKYNSEVAPALTKQFKLGNVHQLPKLQKIVVNMGVGQAIENKKRLDAAARDMTIVTGQKAQIRRAKRSVASFHLREGVPVGCRVTLRGARMYEFLDRLLSLVMPRIRDFRGIRGKGFDGRGNFSMGLTDQMVFPEIEFDKVEWQQGMDITCVVTGGSDEMSKAMLLGLGVPFRKDD